MHKHNAVPEAYSLALRLVPHPQLYIFLIHVVSCPAGSQISIPVFIQYAKTPGMEPGNEVRYEVCYIP